MERNDLRGSAHTSPVNVAMKVRISLLTVLVIIGSIALALTFLNPHQNARASTVVETATTKNPWVWFKMVHISGWPNRAAI